MKETKLKWGFPARTATEKWCNDCKKYKPFSAFTHRSEKHSTNLFAFCGKCMSARSTAWNKANPEKCKQYKDKYYKHQKFGKLVREAAGKQ